MTSPDERLIRPHYESVFALFPDGRCDLRTVVAKGGRGVTQSLLSGTLAGDGSAIEALGPELLQVEDGTITEIRYRHRLSSDDLRGRTAPR